MLKDTDVDAKVTARDMVARISTGASVTRRQASAVFGKKISRKVWGKSKQPVPPKRSGRPRGSIKIRDEELKEILAAVASSTSQFKADGSFNMALPGSLKNLHATMPRLRQTCSYSTLQKRNKRSRLGFVVAKKRTDVCIVCQQWDKQASPVVRGDVAETMTSLTKVYQRYFQHFQRLLAIDDDQDAPDSVVHTSPSWQRRFFEYIQTHPTRHAHERASIASDMLERLVDIENRAVAQLEMQTLPVTLEWQTHFRTRDIQQAALRRDLDCPAADATYILLDYQEFVG